MSSDIDFLLYAKYLFSIETLPKQSVFEFSSKVLTALGQSTGLRVVCRATVNCVTRMFMFMIDSLHLVLQFPPQQEG